jgi:hypothetical protein
MSVSYDVFEGEERLLERREVWCFGSLSGYLNSSNTPTHVRYYPKWDMSDVGWDVWAKHLLTMPIIQDALHSPIDFSLGRDVEVNIRCDMPADRLLNMLSLFRLPRVHPALGICFQKLLRMDVEGSIAFVLATTLLEGEEGLGELSLATSFDDEHGFTIPKYLHEADARALYTHFQGEGWEEYYKGEQDVYSESCTYRRGELWDGETCLMDYAHRGGEASYQETILPGALTACKPHLSGIRMGDLRSSQALLSNDEVMSIVEHLENIWRV